MSRAVEGALARMRERASERDRGAGVALGLRMTSARAADIGIVSVMRLPAVKSDTPAQDEDGNFLYNEWYSDPTDPSPDIGAPDDEELFLMGGMGFAGGFVITTPGPVGVGAFTDPEIVTEDAETIAESVDADTAGEDADPEVIDD